MAACSSASALELKASPIALQKPTLVVERTHRVSVFCPLLETIVEVVPVSKAVVHVAHPVELLELMHWRCTQQTAGNTRSCLRLCK